MATTEYGDFNFSSSYKPPGVYTVNDGGPQLSVRSSVPTAVAIFGLSAGYRTFRESVKIKPDTEDDNGDLVAAASRALTKKGIRVITTDPVAYVKTDAEGHTVNVDLSNPGLTFHDLVTGEDVGPVSGDLIYLLGQTKITQNGLYRWTGAQRPLVPVVDTFKVLDPASGDLRIHGRDYTIERYAYAEDDASTTRDDMYVIKRVISESSQISQGDTVQVNYRYTPVDYFDVKAHYDYDDIRDFYGEPFDADGNILSEITLAARFALVNGASTIMTCAVDPDAVDSDGNPLALEACYVQALKKFEDHPQIAIIAPATGQEYIYSQVRSHVHEQAGHKYERRAVLGFDGSTGKIATGIRQDRAMAVGHERIALVSPSQFDYFAPELGRTIVLGGQYMAAAIAGKSASMIASMPLTRKSIDGFYGPSVEDSMREGEKDVETQNGLMVVEKTARQKVQVRHGVTTDPTDLLTREWSIIGQRDVMVYRIRDYLDNDGLIGMPIYDTTLVQVKASALGALESLVRDNIIVGYQNLKVRQIGTQPDVIEVRYEWKPAYPLNYIVVRYSVSVQTGDVTPTST